VIAALYVAKGGCYYGLPNVEPWGLPDRDAREYRGPWPVVAHPPCQLWVNFAFLNFKRYGGEHNRPGNDGGCFAAALGSVERYGGVLEHPADSWAWREFGLPRPSRNGWTCQLIPIRPVGRRAYACEVRQATYGHRARKRTWLYYVGDRPPPSLNWSKPTGTHQVGWFDRLKPPHGKNAASASPIDFRDLLISIAESARGPLSEPRGAR
jgi:hypothetical protein